MKVTLVLATVGRTVDVGRLVQSLDRQTVKDFELIVVDQNSDDRLLPYVAQAGHMGIDVKHLRLQPPSLSGARNLGIAEASGDVIAFPDDDCWYEPDVIANVVAAFATHNDWDGVVVRWVEQWQAQTAPPDEPVLSHARWYGFRGDCASSISLFMTASLMRRLDGFDRRLGVGQWFGAGEEVDLLLRALAAGVRIGRCHEAKVHHRFGGAAPGRLSQVWRAGLHRGRGGGALFAKHSVAWPVVFRCVVGPPVKAALQGQGLRGIGLGLAIGIGRLQGALTWRREQD